MKYLLWTVLCLCNWAAFSQDLIISNYTRYYEYDRYALYVNPVTVKNIGIVETTSRIQVEWYISTDSELQESSDILIDRSHARELNLKPGATLQVVNWEDKSYINVLPGTYYLLIRVVPNPEYIPETDYTNNMVVIPNVVVRPPNVDFKFTTLTTDKSKYSQWELIRINYGMQNLGATPAGGSVNFRFLISKDARQSADDIEVPFDGIPYDGATIFLRGQFGFSSPSTIAVLAPAVPPGNYYVLAIIDQDGSGLQKYEETDESNNVTAAPITIQASDIDLAIVSSNMQSSSDSDFKGSVVIRNNSSTWVSGYDINLQLVKSGAGKPTIWESNRNVNYERGAIYGLDARNIPPNAELKFDCSLMLSQQPEPGTYDIVVGLNVNQQMFERDYSNNVYIQAGQLVIEPQPTRGLALHSVDVTSEISNTTLEIPVSLNIENTGDLSYFGQTYIFSIADAQDQTLSNYTYGVYIDFAPGESATQAFILARNVPLSAGNYKVTVTCASLCNTTPTQISTTFTVTSPQYVVSGHVQGEDGTPINKGKIFLYRKETSGKIRFIQKIAPYAAETFALTADTDPSTLYFIPDPVAYPDYIPTIYGKTVTLQPSNFFMATKNMNVVMEVLKLRSLAVGNGIISGHLTTGQSTASGRQSMSVESVEGMPVILMSSAGQPVRIAYTDEFGNFKFENLPRDNYQVFVAFELDAPVLMNPYAVDITTKNAEVNLELTSEGIEAEVSQLLLPQMLTFSELAAYRYGDGPVTLDAESDAHLPIVYTSSDETVATVVDGKAIIHAAGETSISAIQAGNDYYLPVVTTRLLTIDKAVQSIAFEALPRQLSTAEPFSLQAIASSGLAVSFESSDESIVSIEGNTAKVNKGGSVVITARQAGNHNYEPAEDVSREQLVEIVTATEFSIEEGNLYPNPTTGIVVIDIPNVSHVEVTDMVGRVLGQVSWQGNILDLSHSPDGLYTVKFILPRKTIVTKVLKR